MLNKDYAVNLNHDAFYVVFIFINLLPKIHSYIFFKGF